LKLTIKWVTMKSAILINIFLLIFFASCQKEASYYEFGIDGSGNDLRLDKNLAEQAYSDEATIYEEAAGDINLAVPARNVAANVSSDSTQRKLIKTANIRFQVKALEATIEEVEKIVASQNALVVTSNLQNNSYQKAYDLTIRVPFNKFETLVDEISLKAEVLDNKEISAQDVTEEFVDVSARLKAKKQVENRYLEILKQANNVNDILEVEKKLGEIREEIEATEGRLRYLRNQVSLSTIHLYVYQVVDKQNNQLQPSFFARVSKGFGEGWDIFLDFVVSLSYIWPFLILIFVSIFLVRRWVIRRKKKRKIKATPQDSN